LRSTTENDRSYFRDHPEYHMYLHPAQPRYESLIAARDRFVARHPKLNFVGAHLASLEWSVDELAKFLDTFPNATADLAARMTQVQTQSKSDPEKVRGFFVKYQDRLLYGSDLTENPPEPHARAQNPPMDPAQFAAEADTVWRSDWVYLATSEVQPIDDIKADVKGLALPKPVIDKIYYANARRVFGRSTQFSINPTGLRYGRILARAGPSNPDHISALSWLTPQASMAVTAIDEKPIAIWAAALVHGNLAKRQQ
jgi:hypothetical protein